MTTLTLEKIQKANAIFDANEVPMSERMMAVTDPETGETIILDQAGLSLANAMRKGDSVKTVKKGSNTKKTMPAKAVKKAMK